jgi:protein SCO1/2
MYLGRNTVHFAILFACAVFWACGGGKSNTTAFDKLPELRTAPILNGTNYDGSSFTSASLAGKIWIADFIFTTCAEICPKMNGNTAQLVRETQGKIPIVSTTVDPEYDSLSVLREYAGKYAGSDSTWRFITMPLDSVREVTVKGFGVGNYENPLEHSTRLILIDGNGKVRGYFDGTDSAEVKKLTAILQEVLP